MSTVGSWAVKRRLYMCRSTVIFGVCNSVRLYSSCVKICFQEMNRGDCNRLRTLVCVNSELKSVEIVIVLYLFVVQPVSGQQIHSPIQNTVYS
jgi:hypothetical protein